MHSRYEEKRGLPLHTWRSAIMVRPPGGESESPNVVDAAGGVCGRLIDDWIACGGGTSSFEAIEAEAMLEFIAGRLPTPSHEWTVCRFEQAAMRVHEVRLASKHRTRRCSMLLEL